MRKRSPGFQLGLQLDQLCVEGADMVGGFFVVGFERLVLGVEVFDVRLEVLDVSVFSFAECALCDAVLFAPSLK